MIRQSESYRLGSSLSTDTVMILLLPLVGLAVGVLLGLAAHKEPAYAIYLAVVLFTVGLAAPAFMIAEDPAAYLWALGAVVGLFLTGWTLLRLANATAYRRFTRASGATPELTTWREWR